MGLKDSAGNPLLYKPLEYDSKVKDEFMEI